ncbi:MAG: radical SAM protein [Candidatus Uhrbacteria bacterium]
MIRQESFGGTVFNPCSGERTYVNQEEYVHARKNGQLPDDLKEQFDGKIKFVEPILLPKDNFSSADMVFFEVTRACNVRCVHCFNQSGARLKTEMTLEEMFAVIEDLATSGVQEIRFTGGEPLILPNFHLLINQAVGLGMRVSIGTNAMLANDKVVARLQKAGLRFVVVSLHGPEIVHDTIQGAGSFQAAIRGLVNFKDQGPQVRVNTVVMKSNYQAIKELASLLLDYEIPVFIRRLIPAGRANAQEMLSESEYADLKRQLIDDMPPTNRLINGHYLREEPVKTRITLPFQRRMCSAGHRGMVVLPDGRVQTCGFLGSLGEDPIGNLRYQSMAEIWASLLTSGHIKRLRCQLDRFNSISSTTTTNCLALAVALGE